MPGVRTNAWSNVWPGIGTQVQGCTSPRRASCLSSSPRTWARLCEPGQPCPRSHERVNARISGVNAHLQWLACELHATPGTVVPNTHRLSRNTPISTFSPKRSAIWVPHRPEPRTHRPEPRPHRHQMGGIAPLGARQKAPNAANPHHYRWRQAPSRMQGPSLVLVQSWPAGVPINVGQSS